MTDVFGIDLGTTYSAIAYINEHGLPEVIRNHDNSDTTPSVVLFESPTNAVVGATAKNSAVVEPDSTVSLIKRAMGTPYETDFFGVRHTPETISALILKELVRGAREATGIDTNQVVITVPAYFGVTEKEATKQAGEIAGLEVVGIVTEPVAAALSYGFRKGGSQTLFVYDLGGGTFDTTIMRTSPTSIDVIVTEGNRRLGGADWDLRLIDFVAEKFAAQAGLGEEDPLDDEDFRQALTTEAEIAKQALTKKEATTVVLSYGAQRERIEVTREDFERITADLLEATLEKVDVTLAAAKEKDPALAIDEVLLVGGSSIMPAVSAALKARYGWDPKLADPHLAVAKGAALYGLEPQPSTSEGDDDSTGDPGTARTLRTTPLVNNVLPKGLGILYWDTKTSTEYVHFLASAQTDLPTPRLKEQPVTSHPNATEIRLKVYEQAGEKESERPEDNNEVTPSEGAVFTNLPSLPQGSPIDIYLQIDNEGLATIEAFEPTTGQQLNLQVRMAVMQAPEQAKATEDTARIGTSS
jgi:molecular chaperone DnaK (HSP70)